MDDIFLLQSDQRAISVLMGALDPPHRIRLVRSLAELELRLQGSLPEACILCFSDPPSSFALHSLRRLRIRHPTAALVVAADFRGREMELYHLGRLSVDGVIRMEAESSPRGILAVVDGAIARSLSALVILKAAPDLPPLAREAIRWTIEHAEARPQVSELAAALGMTPRVLLREMTGMNLAPPRSLLLWGRLIWASYLLERPSETVESVAFHLGYATGGALGKALKRHVGCSPTHLLERGGLVWTLDIFQRTGFRQVREERNQWAKPGS